MSVDPSSVIHPLRKAEKIEAAIQEQFGHLQEGLTQTGFLKGMVGNTEAWAKIAASFTGSAINIAFYAVAKQVVLFICRTYDTNGNSLPYLCENLNGMGPLIETKRRKENPDWLADRLELGRVDQLIYDLHARVEETRKSDAYISIRRLRTEHLAHLLEGRSDISQRLARDGRLLDDATFDQIINLAELAAAQIADARRIWTFEVYLWKMLLEHYEDHTRGLFRIMPTLKEAERARRVSDES